MNALPMIWRCAAGQGGAKSSRVAALVRDEQMPLPWWRSMMPEAAVDRARLLREMEFYTAAPSAVGRAR